MATGTVPTPIVLPVPGARSVKVPPPVELTVPAPPPRVTPEEVSSYGVFDVEVVPDAVNPNVLRVKGMVEKPKPEDAFRSIDLGEVSGTVASFAAAFLLEYADGMPMSQVGWGRVDRSTITELLGIHSAYFDLMYRTPYRAQVEASNLALHMMATLEQAASGRPEAGAIGPVGSRLVIIVGHDGNVASVGGLLGLSWIIDGSQPNPLYPGGALDFELRRDPDGHLFVRAFYVAQTLDQMRGADVLSVDHPPARSAIFIPGASEAKPGYDAPLDKLRALVANRARSEWFESTDGLLP